MLPSSFLFEEPFLLMKIVKSCDLHYQFPKFSELRLIWDLQLTNNQALAMFIERNLA